jgi:hypothetical protein
VGAASEEEAVSAEEELEVDSEEDLLQQISSLLTSTLFLKTWPPAACKLRTCPIPHPDLGIRAVRWLHEDVEEHAMSIDDRAIPATVKRPLRFTSEKRVIPDWCHHASMDDTWRLQALVLPCDGTDPLSPFPPSAYSCIMADK